jgi:outer membrane protein OmpA-like peptidoglycan-associated protein
MLSSGVDLKRLQCKGYGESRLLNDCNDGKPCGELEHAMNRRIEFKILGE